MKYTTIAVDADLAVYRIGHACQEVFDDPECAWLYHYGNKEAAAVAIQANHADLLRRYGKDATIVYCLSDEDNFRKDVLDSYKGNRSDRTRRPLLFQWIRNYLVENYAVECWPNLEADDVVGILITRDSKTLGVSIDKDFLTVPGPVANPMKDWQVIHPTEEEADRTLLVQTLTGDATDNYKGCPGVGPVGAEKVLVEGTWDEVVAAFEKKGLTAEDALVNGRCARILRHGEYSFDTNEVKLWNPK